MMDILKIMFERFDQIITANEGIVDKFIGDAIMAVWNVPDPVDNPAQKAMNAVISIVTALDELNSSTFEPKMGGKMKLRIGVHYGEVYVGNVGSRDRLNYTVIGNDVNLGARLEPLNKDYGTSILVTDQIRKAIDPSVTFRCLGFTPIRGFSKPVRVHEYVGGRGEPLSAEKQQMMTKYIRIDEEMTQHEYSASAGGALLSELRSYCSESPEDYPAQHALKVLNCLLRPASGAGKGAGEGVSRNSEENTLIAPNTTSLAPCSPSEPAEFSPVNKESTSGSSANTITQLPSLDMPLSQPGMSSV